MGLNSDRLYTAEQVRRLDRCAIETHGIAGIELMERAGREVFDRARARFPGTASWAIFCGGGNNGGDGYIVARLAQQAGLTVTVCALRAPASLSGDAAEAARRWLEAGGMVQAWPLGDMGPVDLVVDALLGTGLDRAPQDEYAAAISAINTAGKPVVAVDIPSGLNSDTGNPLGEAVRADLTVTFIGRKCGMFTADGPDHCGQVAFSDLEVPEKAYLAIDNSGILIRENVIAHSLPRRRRNSHKGTFGWVLCIGGSSTMSGAVRLCGLAALRSGAGKVTLATSPENAALASLASPELMARGVRQGKELSGLLSEVSVVVLGTGLGQDDWSLDLLTAGLTAEVPVVLDADGLNILAGLATHPEKLEALPRGRWVLTPHPAEAGRLLGCSPAAVQDDRVVAAQRLAELFDAIVVLKGCGSVVSDARGRYAICPLGNPGMASAGTGDVLAGVIGAMLAQGLGAWDSAITGVVAHAGAGDRAAGLIGERGLIASDTIEQLPWMLNP